MHNKNSNVIYKDWQLQKIRDAIQVFRELGQKDGGGKYSWISVAEAISEVTGVAIPPERLRKFVMGEPHRGSDKKSLNKPHYPKLNGKRLEVMIAFLTREDSDGFMFPRKALEIKPSGLSAIFGLAEHLNKNRHSKRMSDASGLCGNFIADHNPTDIFTTITLRFHNATHNGVVPFVLLKKFANDSGTSELSEYSLDQIEEANQAFDRYEGWGVMTPEESIILLAKNRETDENLLYITLGIDKALYLSQPAKALVLLEIEQPEDSLLVQLDHDKNNPNDLLKNVKEALSQQLLLFMRDSN